MCAFKSWKRIAKERSLLAYIEVFIDFRIQKVRTQNNLTSIKKSSILFRIMFNCPITNEPPKTWTRPNRALLSNCLSSRTSSMLTENWGTAPLNRHWNHFYQLWNSIEDSLWAEASLRAVTALSSVTHFHCYCDPRMKMKWRTHRWASRCLWKPGGCWRPSYSLFSELVAHCTLNIYSLLLHIGRWAGRSADTPRHPVGPPLKLHSQLWLHLHPPSMTFLCFHPCVI